MLEKIKTKLRNISFTLAIIILNIIVSFAILTWARDNILPYMPFSEIVSLILLGIVMILILCLLDLITSRMIRRVTK